MNTGIVKAEGGRLSTVVPEGVTPKDHFAKVFEEIGKYISQNAKDLASDVNRDTESVTLYINLEPSAFVSIDKNITNVVKGGK